MLNALLPRYCRILEDIDARDVFTYFASLERQRATRFQLREGRHFMARQNARADRA